MVQSALVRRADIHARSLAHGLKPFEHLNLVLVIRAIRPFKLIELLLNVLVFHLFSSFLRPSKFGLPVFLRRRPKRLGSVDMGDRYTRAFSVMPPARLAPAQITALLAVMPCRARMRFWRRISASIAPVTGLWLWVKSMMATMSALCTLTSSPK